jgi:lauroyl/myristoyl acyltransferase
MSLLAASHSARAWRRTSRAGGEVQAGVAAMAREYEVRRRIEIDERSYELFTQLRLEDKPALIFAGHLANWELPPWLRSRTDGTPRSCIAQYLGRRPHHQVNMGTLVPAGRDAP